jgi:glycosyltransferase involved in cell wall biosynthesis
MKVLHLVAGSLSGGAARGAYWLHSGLRELGIDSIMLNNSRDNLGDESVISLAETMTHKVKFLLLPQLGGLPKLFYRKRKAFIFNTGFEGVDFTRHPAYELADIVHLHWINGLVAMRTLKKVKKPIVWTMRDMWPLTGGCHYAMDCERFELGCGKCPQLASQKTWDLSAAVVANKRSSLPKHMHIVGISNWLSDCAKRSLIFNDFNVQTITNNINTNDFFPIDTKAARSLLNLPQDKKIILIGARSVNDFYKGIDLFIEAMQYVRCEHAHIVLFGKLAPSILEKLPYPVTSLGFLSDTISLRLAYSSADVFVAPSRMEAFGKTLAESMSCATPVVCFDATGPADIVKHLVTGYKAKPFNTADLAKGIDLILMQNGEQKEYMRLASRRRAINKFDTSVVAREYISLYEEMLINKNGY